MGWFSSTPTRDRKAERDREEAEARLAIAAHEVGHAIGCAAAGIRVHAVRIWGDQGQVDADGIEASDQAKVDGYLVMMLCGWAAGAEWMHRHHGYSRSAALSWARQGARSDWADFRRKKRDGSHNGGWYERQAQNLVRANWSRIERHARELARTGRLTGSRFN
ncbi:hypothetical protein [Amycolatopsis sp. FDAARGOS 1241]|uniref:hypothetical protein n=1 Tax=Amycolatopsis sp. FDAARGOS 1241 TaxID=2778070 RepID=UPI00194F2409|nr:hypothetical protein [Amycolatopsis sp. FDAARGOS 1241]QRP47423.1 hypothetical protein I6J71_05500 [Amycolatopsis sp. FDAARGOS 1241]